MSTIVHIITHYVTYR